MYPLDNANLETNMLPCRQEKFESASMSVNYPHWNQQQPSQSTQSAGESHNVDTSVALYQQHQEILDMLNTLNEKIDRLENQMGSSPRNLNDMILYIIVGMMISLVVYLVLNKLF